MVPNHMGIDSRWVVEHPEWFLQVPSPPFPSYSFNGPDLSSDERVAIVLEDHYWDDSDAAVVFKRRDRWSGEERYIYHGNDGTSFPWNDTAQLDYLRADVREAVIQTILHVARNFPVIRFDAAMVLAKRHIQRLWHPLPGASGAIPSRAEHAMSKRAFDAAMPDEFWREVVDRVAAEAPETLLLAEAFWLMEGYFVRTLGMHRVYNSAFMVLLREEDNATYRKVMRDTLEFDPQILGRFVNFMTNPDEKPASEQFGTGDKHFAVATLMATLPGLPMHGHGQFEGFKERYGHEFSKAGWDEPIDEGMLARYEREIVPLLAHRGWFAGSRDFLLYDVVGDDGSVREDVLAYSNVGPGGERSLVVVHNRHASTAGRIQESVGYAAVDPGSPASARSDGGRWAPGWASRVTATRAPSPGRARRGPAWSTCGRPRRSCARGCGSSSGSTTTGSTSTGAVVADGPGASWPRLATDPRRARCPIPGRRASRPRPRAGPCSPGGRARGRCRSRASGGRCALIGAVRDATGARGGAKDADVIDAIERGLAAIDGPGRARARPGRAAYGPLTDGLLLLRFGFGFTGNVLVAGGGGPRMHAVRCSVDHRLSQEPALIGVSIGHDRPRHLPRFGGQLVVSEPRPQPRTHRLARLVRTSRKPQCALYAGGFSRSAASASSRRPDRERRNRCASASSSRSTP